MAAKSKPKPGKSKAKWIQAATNPKTEGTFSEAAKRAGKTTAEYAQEKAHAPGVLGKRARLALVFEKIAAKKSGKSKPKAKKSGK